MLVIILTGYEQWQASDSQLPRRLVRALQDIDAEAQGADRAAD